MKILMFPWVGHGHIFPYLELAKRLITRNSFIIYICSTLVNSDSIHSFIAKNSLKSSIHFLDLHLQPSPNLPPHCHTTKNLPEPLLLPLLVAFQTARQSFSDILASLAPDLIIFDIFQPWAASEAALYGIPAVHFASYGGAMMSYIHHHYVAGPGAGLAFPSREVELSPAQKKNVDEFIEFLSENVFGNDRDVIFVNYKLSSEIVLLKTVQGYEGKYLDYLTQSCDKRILAVGPLVTDGDGSLEGSKVLDWLDTQVRDSVVYISFGSECFLSNEEIREVATGIEECEANFIWIVRFPYGQTRPESALAEALPSGFLNRVHGRGLVITGWAPQARILGHSNTGAFVSHCGWSSATESVYFGVPIVGMPMKLDQHINVKMVVEAGACVEVAMDERDGVYKGEEIGKAMRTVVAGEGLRRRARELSRTVRSEEERALDLVADELWRLCSKTKK